MKSPIFFPCLQFKGVPFTQSQSVSLKAVLVRQRIVLGEFLTFSPAHLIPSPPSPSTLPLDTLSLHVFLHLALPPLMLLLLLFITIWRTFRMFPQGHHRSLQTPLHPTPPRPPTPTNLPAVKLILSLIRCN